MKPTLIALALAVLTPCALAAPASAEAVEVLLQVTKAQALVDSMQANIEGSVRQGLLTAAGAQPLNDEQKHLVEALPRKLVAAMQDDFSWASLKGDFVKLYAETFSQEEIDGLIAFYRGPLGQALVEKMPTLMNRSMALTQARLAAAMPKLKAAVDAAAAEVAAKR